MSKEYSIALCTYNGEKFLSEQLDSLLNQSIVPSQIVICDDCSTDSTQTIIKKYISNNENIKWIYSFNASNIGYKRNFEQAIHKCTEDIVLLCDQDDIWNYNKAEIILEKLTSKNISVVISDGEVIDADSNSLHTTLFKEFGFTIKKQRMLFNKKTKFNLLSEYFSTGATMAFNKSVILQNLPVPENNYFIHDAWIANIGICLDSIYVVNLPLIKYRLHDGQSIGIKKEQLLKTKSLICILSNKMNREQVLYDYIISRNDKFNKRNIKLMQTRNQLYRSLITTNNRNFFKVMRIFILMYYFKMPEFNTLRLFWGNSKRFLLNL